MKKIKKNEKIQNQQSYHVNHSLAILYIFSVNSSLVNPIKFYYFLILYLKCSNPIYIIEGTLTKQTNKIIGKVISVSIKRMHIPCFFFISPTFRRCPQENNIFLAIVFGYLLENMKSLSQLKLPEIEVKSSR